VLFGGPRTISINGKCSKLNPSSVSIRQRATRLSALARRLEIYSNVFSILASLFPLPLLVIQCIAGPLSSLTSSLLTNPLDVCRTRIQVERERRRVPHILRELWQQEGFNVFTKGLTARLSHSCVYSLFIIFGYETVKRVSLKEEYKAQVRW
jgi:hypothetical protein